MVYEFKLPDIGEGVAEAEVLKWMVKEGEEVKEDQPLVEVMTDKVNVQIPAPRTGTITKIMIKEGEVVKVGQVIVVIADQGATAPTVVAQVQPREEVVAPRAPATTSPPSATGVLATPATRRLARELGVDLGSVKGTGPQGRISDDDVRRSASRGRASQGMAAPVLMPAAHGPSGKEEVVPLRGIRKTIADRMLKSKQTTAAVTEVDEVDMTELVTLRDELKGTAEAKGIRLTYLPFIIKAVVLALKEFPYVNSTLDEQGGNILLKKYYNIGIATDTDQGLVVPVVKDADAKGIFELAAELESLATKARSGQLSLDEVRGSTFTITNVGAIGGLFATPIINIPEAAILGTHKIAKRPVVRDGSIEVRDSMYLSITFDHRVFDGAYAAKFTGRLIETLQDGAKLRAATQ